MRGPSSGPSTGPSPPRPTAQEQAGGSIILVAGTIYQGSVPLHPGDLPFLYRDPFYKFAESVVVGVCRLLMVVGFWDTIVPNLIQRLLPIRTGIPARMALPSSEVQFTNLIYLIPVLGCSSAGSPNSLWPLAFIVGTRAGLRSSGTPRGTCSARSGSPSAPCTSRAMTPAPS